MLENFGLKVDFDEDGLVDIRNCQFKFECDKRWSELERVEGQDSIRFCTHCLKEVYYIDDAWDLVLALKKDWCVAVTKALAITANGVKSINEPLLGSLVPLMHGRTK